jgi:hypothetical protein
MSELSDFVLGYYRLHGAIVEPPRFGVYQVLLPDTLAKELGVPVLQELIFDDMAPEDENGRMRLSLGDPFIDRLVQAARREPAPSLVYVNALRLDKHGLLDAARSALNLPNARLVHAPSQTEARLLSHYVVFTFKVTLTTDEKHERVISVAMDAQAGWRANWAELQMQTAFDLESGLGNLLLAPPRWMKAVSPLEPNVLAALLERAQRAVPEELGETLTGLQRRSWHYLELDRARLQQYYDDIARDLKRRQQRASKSGSDDRAASLQDKLAAVEVERALKLADAEARYRLRIDAELVTVQVIVQPKVALLVQVENRHTMVARQVVWDPLFRRMEPLGCDVCGRPGTTLYLCNGGHLAHAECLLEQQCVDCKRVYCRLCGEQMGACAVCGRPVCAHSLNRCPQCQRGTCSEHRGLCHAQAGAPARIADLVAGPGAAASIQEAEAPADDHKAPPKLVPARGRARAKPERPRVSPTLARARERARQKEVTETAASIEVQIEVERHAVVAFALAARQRELAMRSWELTLDGIGVSCDCDKGALCTADSLLLRPAPAEEIELQIEHQIMLLAYEYRVPRPKIGYLLRRGDHLVPSPRLVLHGRWKDEGFLEQARSRFDEIYHRQHR